MTFFTLVTEFAPLPCVFPFPRIFVGTTAVCVAGKGLVIDGRVAACDRSLFNESASSERKNVVVFPDGVSLDALAVAVTVRGCGVVGISWARLFDEDEDVEEGGANSFKFILSTVTHSSRRRLKLT